MSHEAINDCGRCGEDAYLVSFDGKHFVRVRRASKCKNYRPGQCERSCQTEMFKSGTEAVEDWNATHGVTPLPVRGRNEVFRIVGAPC